MSKATLTRFAIPLLVVFGSAVAAWSNSQTLSDVQGQSGRLQKMIVQTGSVTIDLDASALNEMVSPPQRTARLQFVVAANSFFSVLVFNDLLRGPEQGSMALVAQGATAAIPPILVASLKQLSIEKLPSEAAFDLAVRDAKTGFTFFNVVGHEYGYEPEAQSLSIKDGQLLISKEFANALGRPLQAGAVVGMISVEAAMQSIEITQLANGKPQSVVMPPLRGAAGPRAPISGPDVIVGDLPDVGQFGTDGNFVGIAVGTTSCNNGDQPVDWYALPNTNHPVIPQNLYRMSGGVSNNDRFEQIGQSWLKHAFLALENDQCSLGCNTSGCVPGDQLCPGCSDTYGGNLNGNQSSLGSRAWVNPFTGSFPAGSATHNGHAHTGTSHRITVKTSDLDATHNTGATYFAEGQYVSPTEYTWCQTHPSECNMYNNVSYRQFIVSGSPPNFMFSPSGPTIRMQPAITQWATTGATVNRVQPDMANDGIWFMAYKVSHPTAGVWHYEYALYNENLDRGIQSFSVPLGAGANIINIGFHMPAQEPGWTYDGTFNEQGYSSALWNVTQTLDSITWNSETFAQNQNANAIRWGTLYNFRFDADQPPQNVNATVGFFKTGSAMSVPIQAPGGGTPTPTPSPSATSTPTATATTTPRPSPTPRPNATPRPRPSPAPRPGQL